MPTLRQTPFISGRPTMAGLRERRFFWGLRHPLRTWLSVVARGQVVVNGRKGPLGMLIRFLWAGPEKRGVGWICRAGRRKERSARKVRAEGAGDIAKSATPTENSKEVECS